MRNKIIAAGLTVMALFVMACGAAKPTITGQGGQPAANTSGGAGAPAGPKKFAVEQHATLTLANGSTADIVVSSVKVQGKYLVASVTIACTAGSMSYNMFDWAMIAGDGTKLDTGFSPDVKNQLSSGDLGAGQKITGNVVFQGTAAQAKGAQVQFSSGLDTVAYWVNP